jgi:hypothetical protein
MPSIRDVMAHELYRLPLRHVAVLDAEGVLLASGSRSRTATRPLRPECGLPRSPS